jgi:membrane fusion protein (multidrug efflux system)
MNKLFHFSLCFTFLLLLHSCDNSKANEAAKPAAAVNSNIEGIIAKATTLDQSIQVSGTLIPTDETTIMTEVGGRVVALNLPEGKEVVQGTTLVKLFDGDLQAQLQKLQVQLKIAQSTEQRQRQLMAINGISQIDYDNSLLAVDNLKADIDLVRVNISKTEIRAPFTGKIGLKKISVGAYLTTTTPVATIRAERQLKLDFSVPEKYSNKINMGKKVEFTVQGSGAKYNATIIATEENIESNTRNLKARAIVSGNNPLLVSGGYADVKVDLGENKKAIMIPTQCVIPQARDKRVIVSRGSKASFVKVKTGVREATTVEIEEGIAAGDTIVTTGILFIRPDAVLKFSKVE